MWASIAQCFICNQQIPQKLAEFAGPCGYNRTGCDIKVLRGLAYESGVLPSGSPSLMAREQYFAAHTHIISRERLSLLCANGLAPFSLVGSSGAPSETQEAVLYLTAASVARVVLSPLLAQRTTNAWTVMSSTDLFDGLFAAYAAANQRHARTALLLGKVLRTRFGQAHEDEAKKYYEIAARECNFEACVEMASNGDGATHWRKYMMACAIGPAEVVDAERTTMGEKKPKPQGPWQMALPANADVLVRAIKPVRLRRYITCVAHLTSFSRSPTPS